jgi:hypothetical protein
MDDVKTIYESALKEKETILEILKPLREEENKAIEIVQSAQKDLKEIRSRIVRIEINSNLKDVSQIIAGLSPKQKKIHASAEVKKRTITMNK